MFSRSTFFEKQFLFAENKAEKIVNLFIFSFI